MRRCDVIKSLNRTYSWTWSCEAECANVLGVLLTGYVLYMCIVYRLQPLCILVVSLMGLKVQSFQFVIGEDRSITKNEFCCATVKTMLLFVCLIIGF